MRLAAERWRQPRWRTGGPGRVGRAPTFVTIPVAMAVLLGLIVCLYGSTVTSVRPRELPVVVAGSSVATKAFVDEVEQISPGAMRISVVADTAAADRALRHRDAYAAFVFTPDGLSLRLASAASPAVAEALVRGMALTFPDLRIPVVDVVANVAADHQGGGVSAGYLPLVLVAAAAGALLARWARSRQERLVGLLGFMVAGGVAGTLALAGGLDVLPDGFVRCTVVMAVVMAAVAAPVLGIGAVSRAGRSAGAGGLAAAGGTVAAGRAADAGGAAGRRGLVGAIAVMVIGVALSGASSAPEMLPRPWGELGQLLPPGAGVTLLRSTLYFDGAGGGGAAAVLAVWAVVGIVLVLLGRERVTGPMAVPAVPAVPAGSAGSAGSADPAVPAAAEAGAASLAGQIARPREGGRETSPGVSPREEGFRA